MSFEKGDALLLEQQFDRMLASRLHLLPDPARHIQLRTRPLAAQYLFDELDLPAQTARVTRRIATATATPTAECGTSILTTALAAMLPGAGREHEQGPSSPSKGSLAPRRTPQGRRQSR